VTPGREAPPGAPRAAGSAPSASALRQQSGKEGANQKATDAAWPATLAFLREHLK